MKIFAGLVAGLALLAPSFAFASVGITLSGGDVTVTQGTGYSEPGYSAFSTADGDVTGLVGVSGVDSSVGSHVITYSVTDSALDSATAFRTFTVRSAGNVMPFCSGPLAPGWVVGIPGGGCGGTETFIPAGTGDCPFWFPSGCLRR